MTFAIDNERTKLTANALDRSSTACLAVGMFAPLAGLFQGQAHVHSVPAIVSIAGWFAAAVVLHYAARHVLGGLTQ